MIYRTVTIKAKITDSVVAVSPSLSGDISVTAELITKVIGSSADPYTGETEFTPTEETQVVPTENFFMTSNIIINPIPSNYGLITWNGAVLTVS